MCEQQMEFKIETGYLPYMFTYLNGYYLQVIIIGCIIVQ